VTDGWLAGWLDGWMDGWMDIERQNVQYFSQKYS
jgi:hypothetical protein